MQHAQDEIRPTAPGMLLSFPPARKMNGAGRIRADATASFSEDAAVSRQKVVFSGLQPDSLEGTLSDQSGCSGLVPLK